MIDEDFILSRINRSKEALDEAKLMFSSGYNLTMVNRLYYAVFYLVSAYLATKGLITKTHSGAKAQFQLEFVKAKIVDENLAGLYNDLFHERNDSDYGDFETISKEDAKELLSETEVVLKEYWERFEAYRKTNFR